MTHDDIDRYEHDGTLTRIQAEVLRYRLRGVSWRIIADGLLKDPATIRGHHAAAMRRIKARKEQAA
jgi:DNA-binding NarL/FixJ family response regulator